MIDYSLLLQATSSRERRRAILRTCEAAELAALEANFKRWEPNRFPAGPLLLADVEAEEQRRRVLAAAGE